MTSISIATHVTILRILICSNAYPPDFVGGAELMAHEQAKALTRMGHEVRVFAGQPDKSLNRHTRADALHEGIRVHRIALAPEDYSPEFLNFLHPTVDDHFRNVLQEFTPDIVHCHNLMGLSVKIPILARLHGAGTVCTLHDFWGFCLRNTAVRADGRYCDDIAQCRSCLPRIHDGRRLYVPMRLRKDFIALALDQIDRFVAPSNYLAQRYVRAGWLPEQIEVIPNGIDIDRFQPKTLREPTSKGPVRITYVGYFGEHKGVLTLLEAVKALSPLVPPVLLQLVGEGPQKNAYLARIETLGLQECVRFIGKVAPNDMPRVYDQSDIVVLPSVWDENQPVSLMEAMASGLPVVASRKGGIPEMVEHGVSGLMFTAGDPADLATQLATLTSDPDLRQRAGQEGRRRAEQMNHDHQACYLVALYARVARLALPARELVHSRDVYAALGSLRDRTSGENASLDDGRYPSRRFLPFDWIADCAPQVSGVILMGWPWSMLRLRKWHAVIPLPATIGRLVRQQFQKHFVRKRS